MLKYILCLLLAAGLTACQKKSNEQEEDAMVTAYKLIDAQRFSEAIHLLELEIEKGHGDPEYIKELKVAQASAYAGRAGFSVRRLGAIIELSKSKMKFNGDVKLEGGGKSEAVDSMLRSIGGQLLSFNLLFSYYASIPSITAEAEPDLLYSIRILDSLGTDVNQAQAAYRAIIKIVYLKNYISMHVVTGERPVELQDASCVISFTKLQSTLIRAVRIAIQILDDLALAKPSKAESYANQRRRLSNAASSLTFALTSVSLLDDATKAIIRDSIFAEGLGRLLKCVKPASTDSAK